MVSSDSVERPVAVSVVIPAYNEEARLAGTLERVLGYLEGRGASCEVLVADDGSTDATAQIVRRFAERSPQVRLLSLEHRGKAYAVRAGVLAAKGDLIYFADADLATPIQELEKFLEKLSSGFDVAYGSREGIGARRLGEPIYRHLMGRVFNLLVQLLALPGINDTQCGFKAFRREAAQDLFRRVQLYGEDSPLVKGSLLTGFDVEVLYLARRRGYRLAEVPVTWHYGAQSKVSPLKDSWRNLRDVLRVRWNALKGRY